MVLNKYKDEIPPDAIYIGRPSRWGNPFAIGRDGDREEVVLKFLIKLLDDPVMIAQVKRELKGKALVCFCAPALCHGHVLEYVANEA